MNINKLNEELEKILEEQINEMAIKPWKPLPPKRNPKDCITSVKDKNKDRVQYLMQYNRKSRQFPFPDANEEEHRVGCQSKYKIFTYNGKDYYFGILWGEEDKPNPNDENDILKGNGLAHILVNHPLDIADIIQNLNLAISRLNSNNIFLDDRGNLEIDVVLGDLKYVFKNYKELDDNYFYLHTAYNKKHK